METGPTPSPNIHIFLPSGVAVIDIDLWVERFTKIFQNVQLDQEASSSYPTRDKIQLYSLEYHTLPIIGGDL
jgi:hypothetical protein